MDASSALHAAFGSVLHESAAVLCARSPAAVDAAVPALSSELTPVHMGSQHVRSMIFTQREDYADWQVEGTAPRAHFQLLLVARVRSLLPLMRWAQQHVLAASDHPVHPQYTPAHVRALLEQLHAYAALLRAVQVELQVTYSSGSAAAAARGVGSWLRVMGGALRSALSASSEREYASTSTLPALLLWLRLIAHADGIVAAMPLTAAARTTTQTEKM